MKMDHSRTCPICIIEGRATHDSQHHGSEDYPGKIITREEFRPDEKGLKCQSCGFEYTIFDLSGAILAYNKARRNERDVSSYVNAYVDLILNFASTSYFEMESIPPGAALMIQDMSVLDALRERTEGKVRENIEYKMAYLEKK